MSEGHHDLAHEFPEYKDRIHELKLAGGHFAVLMARYHDLVKELHLIETGQETPSDEYVEQLKKQRLAVKDEIAALLRKG